MHLNSTHYNTIFENVSNSDHALLITDGNALVHNYKFIQKQLNLDTLLAPVLKANAYGMGMKFVGKILFKNACRHFFVGYLSEALELRQYLGEEVHLYVLSGLQNGEEEEFARNKIIPVLCDIKQIVCWNNYLLNIQKRLEAAIYLDTGLSRSGINIHNIRMLGKDFFTNMNIICLISHLINAYQHDNPTNFHQLTTFKSLRNFFPSASLCLSNSAGIFLGKQYHFDMVRPGIALTGCRSAIPTATYELKPTLSCHAKILQINHIKKGNSVGYKATFITHRNMRIAILGVGFGDGYPRSLSNIGKIYFKGFYLSIIGMIAMDSLAVDITDIPKDYINVGDWMELFGNNLEVDKVSKNAGMVPTEFISRLGGRITRSYFSGEV